MAEAAKTVKYHVSDFLQDRHPYNVATSFETQRQRDAGKVFNGLEPAAVASLLQNVGDSSIDATQRAVALRHLLAHSASPEKKIQMIHLDVVGILASLLTAKSGQPPIVESLIHTLFRSLAVLPQGCHAIIEEGGLAVVLHTLTRQDNEVERNDARIMAALTISQIASNWAGRAWLLHIPAPKDFELINRSVSTLTEEQREQLAEDVVGALIKILEKHSANRKLTLHVAHALSDISMLVPGLHRTLMGGALRAVQRLLKEFSADDVWLYNTSDPTEAMIVVHLATYVWHVGLDEVGLKEALEEGTDELVASLGKLVTSTNSVGKLDQYPLRAALVGALSALVLETKFKKAAIVSLASANQAPLDALIQQAGAADTLISDLVTARKSGAPAPFLSPSFDMLTAVAKNTVQAIRLVAELPDGRTHIHRVLPKDDKTTESLRRSIFFSTPWQQEFGVTVY